MTLLPGPITFLIYNEVVAVLPEYALSLSVEKKDISSLIASFSFTMLGFLAAIITILFAFVHSRVFVKYKTAGYLDLLFFLYLFTIVNLVFTAFLSIYGFSQNDFIWPFRLMLMSFENNLIQVALISIIISKLAHKASNEI